MQQRQFEKINLLPGPVDIDKKVIEEFIKASISHRSESFILFFKNLQKKLCDFVNAKYVQILMGSGTLSNDVVAAHLSQLNEYGLILTNGHFGTRLISQAENFNLQFSTLTVAWGNTFDIDEIKKILNKQPKIKWIWMVHCETSTGILNDLSSIELIAKEKNIKLCLDCISCVGTLPINLHNVYMATTVSGKAICSFTGLAMVFYNQTINTYKHIPKYFNLAYFENQNGIPFTISSNLIFALNKAIDLLTDEPNYSLIHKHSLLLRKKLTSLNYQIINPLDISSPAVLSIQLPQKIKSIELGSKLEKQNCFISFRSHYLLEKNIIQTYITRNTSNENISQFIKLIEQMT